MSEYAVKVKDAFSFRIQSEDLNDFDAVQLESGQYHVLHDNQPFVTEIISSNFTEKKYTVRVNNTAYVVTIQDKLDMLIADMGFETDAGKQVNALHAPMPGLILEISAKVGQQVAANEPLLILSAMKMENSFVSPRDGVIKSIAVAVGDAVDKGQLLIEFE
ncbi:MAG: acetyl-CoA carboxylase biotin carboxyl carrier protein subunit [Flavobacterium sp.]|nr:acetyl-CoA carboxylase biotin carboxyl carrier protein subunit [Flavobacterium sp.]